MAQEERLKWRDAVVCGLLWGLVVMLATTLAQPVGGMRPVEVARWCASLTIICCTTGVVWAIGAKLIEERGRVLVGAPVLLVVAWAADMAVTYTPVSTDGLSAPGDFGRLLSVPLFDLSVYNLWTNLFYGGLYTLGYFATRRTLRLRRKLAALRLARSEAEAQLREARLRAVRGQIQPDMLLDALAALQRAYGRDQDAADRMFDLLIAFLRAAMPGLRSGVSTLAAELAVVDRYAALRKALEAGPPAWRLRLEEPPDTAFPPLRLLPALDRMSRATPAHAAVEVRATPSPDAFLVQVSACASEPLPRLLMERLRAAMRRDLGVGAMLTPGLADPMVAELRLTTPPPTGGPDLRRGASP